MILQVVSFHQVYPPCPMPRAFPPPPLHHPHIIWSQVRIMKVFNMHYYPVPCYSLPLRHKHFSLHVTHTTYIFCLMLDRPGFTPIKNIRKSIVLYVLMFMFLDWKLEGKNYLTNCTWHSLNLVYF